ncbi:ComF family protein [Bacillus sp. DTU_2020_1000418_1_SI_GHA_SEK_038]|uniref:ComF family protein n=1 Tax=Bacillus sp. DTU_2020_1000418_1_SI_GHA_SEK_038 TaxID=3077585 RepID=UPI0028E89B84|nr:ComF family protein [Bacillus sp. DTU_2020_1000418_1_SI_GHA_SEK_038]WNS75097.1 ComF family protein [Bacillus sp. DTU_2020_1000418_1_SI_GHA_SEK_038]
MSCHEKFSIIIGETCRTCVRPLDNLEPQFKLHDQCLDCVRWEGDPQWAGTLEKNYSIVMYNDFAKEVMAQYKYRGDYVLSNVFASFMRKRLTAITFDLIVPIPLSDERLYERGFNQSEALIRACGLEPSDLFTRINTEKQSKKSRSERIHLEQVFQIKEPISDQNILLIDDIYTTGSTLRHAAKCLKEAGARSVCSLTFARG